MALIDPEDPVSLNPSDHIPPGVQGATGELRTVGPTVYYKVLLNGRIAWVVSQKRPTDDGFAFTEHYQKDTGRPYYARIGKPADKSGQPGAPSQVTWTLPAHPTGAPEPPRDPANRAQGSASIPSHHNIKLQPMPGWTREARDRVIEYVQSRLRPLYDVEVLDRDTYTNICGTVCKTFFAHNPHYNPPVHNPQLDQHVDQLVRLAIGAAAAEPPRHGDSDGDRDPATTTAVDAKGPTSLFFSSACVLHEVATIPRDNARNPNRGELEDEVEDVVFGASNKGVVRVLQACPMLHTVLDPTSGIREERHIAAVVKDWAGGVAMVIITAPAPPTNAYRVVEALPLIEEFYVEEEASIHGAAFPHTLKFVLDGRGFTFAFTQPAARTLFIQSMLRGFGLLYGSGDDDSHVIRQRCRSVQLAAAYHHAAAPDAILSRLLRARPSGAPAAAREVHDMFINLRPCIMQQAHRDRVLADWVAFVTGAESINRRDYATYVRVVAETVNIPLPLGPSVDPRTVLHALELFAQAAPTEHALCVQIKRVREQFATMVVALSHISPRDDAPPVHFEENFFHVRGSAGERRRMKQMEARRDLYRSKCLDDGLYLVALCIAPATKDFSGDGHDILADENGMPPAVQLMYRPQERYANMSRDDPDFLWALRLLGTTANTNDEIDAYALHYSSRVKRSFRAQLINGIRRLRKDLGVSSGGLGALYDRPVVFRDVNACYLVLVLPVTPSGRANLVVGGHLAWRRQLDMEYLHALHSLVIPDAQRVDHLPANFGGPRWVRECLNYAGSFEELGKMPAGTYVMYLGVCHGQYGYRVLCSEGQRLLPPCVRVFDRPLTKAEWRWLQEQAERKARHGVSSFAHFYDQAARAADPSALSFKHRIAFAMAELEECVGQAPGSFDFAIYANELVSVDQDNTMQVILCVRDFSENPRLALPSRGGRPLVGGPKLVWKDGEAVEGAVYHAFYWRTYRAYRLQRAVVDAAALAVRHPILSDETLRSPPAEENAALAALLEMDAWWLPCRWLLRTWQWATREGMAPLTNVLPRLTRAGLSVQEAVDDAVVALAKREHLATVRDVLAEGTGNEVIRWAGLRHALAAAEQAATKQAVADATEQAASLDDRLRSMAEVTYDEIVSEEDELVPGDEILRKPTVYRLPCTLEEFVSTDPTVQQGALSGPSVEELCRSIVYQCVDRAAVLVVDVEEMHEVAKWYGSLLDVICAADRAIEGAVVECALGAAVDAVHEERNNFLSTWRAVYTQGEAADAAVVAVQDQGLSVHESLPAAAVGLARARKAAAPSGAAVRTVRHAASFDFRGHSYDGVIRHLLHRHDDVVSRIETLLRVATSAQDVVELADTFNGFEGALDRRDALLTAAATDPDGEDILPSSDPYGPPPVVVGGEVLPSGANGKASAARRPGRHDDESAATDEFVADRPLVLVVPRAEGRTVRVGASFPRGRARALRTVTGRVDVLSVDDSEAVRVVADALTAPDLAAWLADVPAYLLREHPTTALEDVLAVANEVQAPHVFLRVIALLHGASPPLSAVRICDDVRLFEAVRAALEGSFVAAAPLSEWFAWEREGGEALRQPFDVMWYLRWRREARVEGAVADHIGAWRSVYAESRVHCFLANGAANLSRDEIALWKRSLGAEVEYLSLRDTDVGDAEMAVLAETCAKLKSLDICNTNVTDVGLRALHALNPRMDLNVEGTQCTAAGLALFRWD